MSFDKIKAMRNAERFLAQGKIRSAITEYRQVVDNDSKDFGTLNLLGDLYTKNSETAEAVNCYTLVAEHYSNQGFAQKAIAIYNKISKLQPNSVEISAKLAELYKFKGSVTEARSHYITLAEHYQSKGRKIEALAIWKQIALLDPNNTEVYLTLAKSYLEEGETNDAVEAYTEAGVRFAKQGRHKEGLAVYLQALELLPSNPAALAGYVESSYAVGSGDEAVAHVAALLEAEPHNRDLLCVQIDLYLRASDTAAAEKAMIRLVELEPANYPRFLELAQIYTEQKDFTSATRILTMSSEHLLVGGQAEQFHALVSSVLELDPDQLDALRLLARYCSWQRDEAAFRDSLERLADVAGRRDALEDERYALSQLVMIVPQEARYAERLKEINELHGYDQTEVEESLFDKRFLKNGDAETLAGDSDSDMPTDAVYDVPVGDYVADFAIVDTSEEFAGAPDTAEHVILERAGEEVVEAREIDEHGFDGEDFADSPELRLQREVESIKFYIDSGYSDLAEKAIHELKGTYGDRSEVAELQSYLAAFAGQADEQTVVEVEIAADKTGGFDLSDLRSELGLEEAELTDDSDYETHYHTAIAYHEMGLLEDAIKEFQDAVNLVTPNDGTRRFFQCANLLGHCFMQKGMPNLALTWYQRTLETPGLDDEEKQALWYELAAAYEAEGDMENAGRYFEQVYAENIDFRDVSKRVKNMAVNR